MSVLMDIHFEMMTVQINHSHFTRQRNDNVFLRDSA